MKAGRASSAPIPTAAVLRTLLGLSWPIVLARAAQSVIGFSDALFVAPLGETELAAVTTGSLNAFAAIVLPTGTVFIVQSFVAQLRGRGETFGVRRYAWYGLTLAALAGLVAAVAIPFVPWLLGHFGYAPGVHAAMSRYLGIRLLSVAAAVGTEALGSYYGGLGSTRPAMLGGIAAMSVNVLGCWALVEPRLGLPGYGVTGAAWASVLGSTAGFAVLVVPFALEVRDGRGGAPLRASELGRVLRFGLPNGFNWFLEFAAFVLFINGVVGHLGTRVLAAFNVVMQLNSVAFMPAFGLASGGAILVGEAIGRKAIREVWPIVRLTALVSAGWMMSVGAVYGVAPRLLMGLFQSPGVAGTELLDVGASMLVFAALWQLFDALGMTLGEALRAAGDTTWCMMARIVLAWVLFTPVAWAAVYVFGGGVPTIMTSLVVYVAALSLTLGARFASGRWKDLDLVGAGPTV
jgi:multidrug resistance protein, MATE family